MAKILKKQTSLDELNSKKSNHGMISIGSGIVITILFWPAGAIVGIILAIIGFSFLDDGDKFKAGAIGEQIVSDLLNEYPDDWYIFNDMIIGESQIDHIVICPKGVFTIETKHWTGKIYGNAKSHKWQQYKNGQDEPFHLYNPVKQGRKHSIDLSNYLKERGTKEWVKTIVVFTNKNATLKISSFETPVITANELKYLFNEEKNILSSQRCEEIVNHVSNSLGETFIIKTFRMHSGNLPEKRKLGFYSQLRNISHVSILQFI